MKDNILLKICQGSVLCYNVSTSHRNIFSTFWYSFFSDYFRDIVRKFHFLSFVQFFQTCIDVWLPLKFAIAETRESGLSGFTFTITLTSRIIFYKDVSLSIKLYIKV